MSAVKTAISLDEELFSEVNSLAHRLKISRSKLFVIAIKDFLYKRENHDLLEKLNTAFSDSQDEEQDMSNKMKATLFAAVDQ